MNSVERVIAICKERKIPISKLEKDLGFSNAYIAQLKRGTFPAERLHAIAKYLDVSPDFLLTGKEEKEKPATSGDGPYPTNPERAAKQEAITRLLPRMTDQELEDLLSEVKARILGQ